MSEEPDRSMRVHVLSYRNVSRVLSDFRGGPRNEIVFSIVFTLGSYVGTWLVRPRSLRTANTKSPPTLVKRFSASHGRCEA